MWDLASGRNTYSDVFEWESSRPVDIDVGSHGGVAWIEPWTGIVTKVDRLGEAKIGRADVPLGDDYDGGPLPKALRVDGDAITWQEHAAPRTYVLNGRARTPR